MIQVRTKAFTSKDDTEESSLNLKNCEYVNGWIENKSEEPDILIAADDPNDPKEIVQRKVQQTAAIYQDGVRQTGGAIRPDKCRWYSISFSWKSGKWKFDTTSNLNNIVLQDENGNDQTV